MISGNIERSYDISKEFRLEFDLTLDISGMDSSSLTLQDRVRIFEGIMMMKTTNWIIFLFV